MIPLTLYKNLVFICILRRSLAIDVYQHLKSMISSWLNTINAKHHSHLCLSLWPELPSSQSYMGTQRVIYQPAAGAEAWLTWSGDSWSPAPVRQTGELWALSLRML